MSIYRAFWSTILTLMTASCTLPSGSTGKETDTRMYNPSGTRIRPVYAVYHHSPEQSALYVKLFPKELLYSMANPEGIYKAVVRIKFQLYEIDERRNTQLVDTLVHFFQFRREGVEQRFVGQLTLHAQAGKMYLMHVAAKDLVRNEEHTRHLYIDKRTPFSQQNFMITEAKTGVPLFSPYILGNIDFKIETPLSEEYDAIYVKYTGRDLPLAKPAFTQMRDREFLSAFDSLWVLPYNPETTYRLSYQGVYFFQLDTSKADGLTLMNFGYDFPRVTKPEDMIGPLAYIATSPAYGSLLSAQSKKLAVDDFWLEKTDNIERARELIRIYYTRVHFANYYFSTFKPGWMTDRGLVFIIYGPPQGINRTLFGENWVYNRKNFGNTVTFNFDYVPSSYSENNFVLSLSEGGESFWRDAILSWRNGRVYNFD